MFRRHVPARSTKSSRSAGGSNVNRLFLSTSMLNVLVFAVGSPAGSAIADHVTPRAWSSNHSRNSSRSTKTPSVQSEP